MEEVEEHGNLGAGANLPFKPTSAILTTPPLTGGIASGKFHRLAALARALRARAFRAQGGARRPAGGL